MMLFFMAAMNFRDRFFFQPHVYLLASNVFFLRISELSKQRISCHKTRLVADVDFLHSQPTTSSSRRGMEDISRGAAGADFGEKGFHDLRKIGAVFGSTNIFLGKAYNDGHTQAIFGWEFIPH